MDPIDVVTECNVEIDAKVIVESYSCNLETDNGETVIPTGTIKTTPENEVLQKLEKRSLERCVPGNTELYDEFCVIAESQLDVKTNKGHCKRW